jgi:hypothetical protein
MAEQWLSIVEYARTFAVSDMTVRRRIKTGRLHAVLQEGKYFIPVPAESSNKTMRTVEARAESEKPTPSAPKNDSIFVVKGHPHAHKTMSHEPANSEMRLDSRERPGAVSFDANRFVIPEPPAMSGAMRQVLEQLPGMLGETRAALAVVQSAVRKIEEAESRLAAQFQQKVEALNATLRAKDHDLIHARQQIEDLQLLVQLLEKKSPA